MMTNNSTKPKLFDLHSQSQTFQLVLILCAVIFVAAVFFFSCLRLRIRQIYIPRLLLIESESFSYASPVRGLFGWIAPAFKLSDDDIFVCAGFDALVFLRFFRMVLKIALITLPYGFIVLIPINFNGANKLQDGLDKLTLSNVKAGTSTIWAHLVAVWFYTLAIYYFSYQEWNVYVKYRQRFLRRGAGNQFAVLVRDIPKELDNENLLKAELDQLFPNKISSVYNMMNLSKWTKLIEKHDSFAIKYERAQEYKERTKKSLQVSVRLCGPKQDALQLYEEELKQLQEELQEEKGKKDKPSLNCAIVIFKSLSASTYALQTVWTTSPFLFHVFPAPEPQEIVWRNLNTSIPTRNARMVLGIIFVFWLVLFWTVPILFISSLTKLDWLSKHLDFLNFIQKDASTSLVLFIQGVLPVLLMSGFQAILPAVLFVVAFFQGFISQSDMAMVVFQYLFIFQAFNVFFIYIISGSVLQNIQSYASTPFEIPDIPQLLAKSLPSQSSFFINYLALSSFVGLAIELTRIVPLLFMIVKLKCFAKTHRDRSESWKPGRAKYEMMYSQALLFFLIGISYSVLSPIVVPFFVIYFGFGYVVWTYQLMHVYIPEWDHGGKFWPEVFYRLLVALCVFQLLMIGVFFLKEMWYCGALVVPLFVLTIVFWWFMASQFGDTGEHLVLKEVSNLQHADSSFLENLRNQYIRDHYMPDIFEVSTDNKTSVQNRYMFDTTSVDNDVDNHSELTETRRLLDP